MIIVYVIGGLIAGVVVLFSFLNWLTARTYKPTRSRVVDQLERVLNGTMSDDEWDEFICVPMRHDNLLENIRLRCSAIQTHEFCHWDNPEEQQKWMYNRAGLQVIEQLLSKLKNNIQQGPPGYREPAAGFSQPEG